MITRVDLLYMDGELKPIIRLNNNLTALIDTGSDRNIWMGSFTVLASVSSYVGKSEGIIQGIGGAIQHPFVLTTSIAIGNLVWDKVHILYTKDGKVKRNVDMILGVTLFQQCLIQIDFANKIMEIDNRSNSGQCEDYIIPGSIHKTDAYYGKYKLIASTGEILKMA